MADCCRLSRLLTTRVVWGVSTPRTNVLEAVVTGRYAFFKTAGPARLAITDLRVTFATADAQGVLITFASPFRGLDPVGLLRHPELTVTMRETNRLAALLAQRRTSSAT